MDHRPDLSFQWTGWELYPGTDRRLVHRSCKDQSPPRYMPAHDFCPKVRPGVEPGTAAQRWSFLLTKEVCCRNTYRPALTSDPGWNRTSTLLHVTQASSPLDHGIVLSMARVGVEPAASLVLSQGGLPTCLPGRAQDRSRSEQPPGFKPGRSSSWHTWAQVVPDGIEPSVSWMWARRLCR